MTSHHYSRIIAICIAAVVVAGCSTPSSDASPPVASTAVSTTAVSGETSTTVSTLATTTPASSTTSSSEPETDYRGLAVVSAACLMGSFEAGVASIGILPLYGVLFNYGLEQGDFVRKDFDAAELTRLRRAKFTAQAFETAATLDVRWQPFFELWNELTQQLVAAWDSGITAREALRSVSAVVDRLEARCRVPITEMQQQLVKQGIITESASQGELEELGILRVTGFEQGWIVEHSRGLLNLDLARRIRPIELEPLRETEP